MNITTPSADSSAEPTGETALKSAAKLHLLSQRNEAPRYETATPATTELPEGGEIPFEDDEALLEEALAAEEAEASKDEEQ